MNALSIIAVAVNALVLVSLIINVITTQQTWSNSDMTVMMMVTIFLALNITALALK